jgi:hypothetical protein
MIRRQRKTHLTVWIALAALLPLCLAAILSLAASQVIERAPKQLEAPLATKGTGG